MTEMRWVEPLFLPAPQDLWESMKNLVIHLPEDMQTFVRAATGQCMIQAFEDRR